MGNVTAKTLAALGLLYVARRYYRNWGTTKEECSMRLPGDNFVGAPAVQSTEGIWIDAPAGGGLALVGADGPGPGWSLQLSAAGEPGGPGLPQRRADPRTVAAAGAGDVVRLAPRHWLGLRDGLVLEVIEIVAGQSIVLRATPARQHWDAVWSFHVFSRWDDRCRLLIRSRTGLRHPGEVLATEIAGPALAIFTRGILMGIKRRAENVVQAEAAAAAASADLHRTR